MIQLAHIVDTHATELIAQDGHRLLPSQLAALLIRQQIVELKMHPPLQEHVHNRYLYARARLSANACIESVLMVLLFHAQSGKASSNKFNI